MFKHGSRRIGVAVLALAAAGALSACDPAADPAPAASTPPSAASTASPAKTSTPQVLGPDGYGALKLGMTPAQADATGLAAPFTGISDGCGRVSHLIGSPTADGTAGSVYHSGKLGVAAIYAVPGVKTPEGVQLGTTFAELKKAYPSWKAVDGDTEDGRGYVKVPGSTNANYRIVVSGGTVSELDIQFVNQDCYE
ncbi:hypothetical protein F4553_003213 [Allocatelliglobosispora scoriae]|uniref:Uncharacterized protein n=1 Tax=Allocatelliglobosispora scoriae TaxID=643052 RepID=A0A841BNJ1_9ACTN|nr:hypothetical protein [Allocatelliglobosispora scoriae]MBB5869834.1 hypothetical protein [Allocatelliglobosispora scoriae]